MTGRRSILWVAALVGAAMVAFLAVELLPGVGFLARGLVAGVFLFAGVAKLRDRTSFSKALAGLGVSDSLARPLAIGVPVLELTVAVTLLVPAASTAGAAGALVLLLALTAAVVVALARGRTTDCGCFGNDRPAPLSTLTLLRNGALIGLAGALAVVGVEHHAASSRWLAAIGVAAFLPLALLATSRTRNSKASVEPAPGVEPAGAGASGEAALTRRRWIGAAGGAGIAGALTLLETSPANAAAPPPPAAETSSCTVCVCCVYYTVFGHELFCKVRCCVDCSGFTGGGTVQTAIGTAQASFSGDTVQLKGSKQVVTGGALSWFDPGWQGTGLMLQSTQITSYGRVPGTSIRQLVGFASANGKGKHKFVLRVVDGGKPGSGQDTVSLTVTGIPGGGTGGTGSQYAASGHLTQGDITTSLQSRVSAAK